MPKISFVIPTHNRVAWLPMCIESLLNQTEQDVEIIVVDDASTDGTDEFLKFYKDNPKVKIITNPKNLGAGASRNIGAAEASAELIGVADSDDCYVNTHAESIIKWFEDHPESELVNFPYVSIDYFDEVIEPFYGKPFDYEGYEKDGGVNYFCNPSSAYKKKSADEIGGYPSEKEGMTDDVQFVSKWLAAGKKIDFSGHDGANNVLFGCMHRILPDSMMSKLRGFDPRWLKK